MSRPAPRKSSLSGLTPVAPAPPANPPTPARTTTKATATRKARPVRARVATETPPSESSAKPKYPPKVSFYQDPEDTARVRGAILHTMLSEGSRTLSQFIHQAVMAEVERLETKYNDGEPFPPIAARELPQGRPMGEG